MAGYSEVAPFAVAFQDTFYTASYSHLVSLSLLTALTNLTSIMHLSIETPTPGKYGALALE